MAKPGDPRIGKHNWVRIAGPFPPGDLPALEFGRYPVTVAEYKFFIESGGYSNSAWWNAGGFGEKEGSMGLETATRSSDLA